MLDSQANSELLVVSNPGSTARLVSELSLTLYMNPWPVDDTRWAPAPRQSTSILADLPQTGGPFLRCARQLRFT